MLVSSIREAELVSFEFCRKIVGTSAQYYSPLIGTEFKLDGPALLVSCEIWDVPYYSHTWVLVLGVGLRGGRMPQVKSLTCVADPTQPRITWMVRHVTPFECEH